MFVGPGTVVQVADKYIPLCEHEIITDHDRHHTRHKQAVPTQEGGEYACRREDFPGTDGEGEEFNEVLPTRDGDVAW